MSAAPRALGALAVLVLCGAQAPAGGEARPPESGERMVTYVELVPGTTVEIRMVPVTGPPVELPDAAAPGGVRRLAPAPFWIGATEITWDQLDAFVHDLAKPADTGALDGLARPTKPYIAADRGFGHNGSPAISVARPTAEAFCDWLSRLSKRRYRLPTEDEWEYAARAGSTGTHAGAPAEIGEHAWHRGNAEHRTHPVGKKKANAFGLFDAVGNAAEWCASADGRGVLRGGSYRDEPAALAFSAAMLPTPAWNQSDPNVPKSKWWLADGPFAGFRIVCEDGQRDAAPPPARAERAPIDPSSGLRPEEP